MPMTFEEKKAWYIAERGLTPETNLVHTFDQETGENTQRPMTEEEFDGYIRMCSEPEDLMARETKWAGFDPKDPSTNPDLWKANRISAYPKLDPQLDGIFHALKAVRDSGVDLGEAGNAYVDEIQAIKDSNPKPTE